MNKLILKDKYETELVKESDKDTKSIVKEYRINISI
jgi:hypothetical protein